MTIRSDTVIPRCPPGVPLEYWSLAWQQHWAFTVWWHCEESRHVERLTVRVHETAAMLWPDVAERAAQMARVDAEIRREQGDGG